MYRNHTAAIIAGLLLGVLGATASLSHYGYEIEEHVGLGVYFHIRGPRPPPPDAVIIALDQESSESLGLPLNPVKWPRYLHAHLVDFLSQKKAAVIVFDIFFGDPASEEDDRLFSEALGRFGKAILAGFIKQHSVPLQSDASARGMLHIETVVPPADRLAKATAAIAPFPLPKVPNRLNQFWLFKTESGSKPSLPVLAFHLFALKEYEAFSELLQELHPDRFKSLPRGSGSLPANGGIVDLITAGRAVFDEFPETAHEMLDKVEAEETSSRMSEGAGLVKAMIGAYSRPDSIYLNFYGPPGTIPTISLHRIISGNAEADTLPDFAGKAVFIGLSELDRPEHVDAYRTVFSRSDGIDLSGVEVAATAFSNLLENSFLRPAPVLVFVAAAFFAGLIFSAASFLLPISISASLTAATALLYLAFAQLLFNRRGIWMPFVIPFLGVSILSLLTGFLWQHALGKRERKDLKKAFGFFLPDSVIDQILADFKVSKSISRTQQIVFGAVLCTDGEQYTTVAESMAPEELGHFLNNYYQAVFKPVEAHSGTVSNIIGDSMLAVWAGASTDSTMRRNACLAALDILRSVENLDATTGPFWLRTRVGLHFGQLLMGSIGGFEHFEYRPVGDVVNTASRLENLNKKLGTRIIVSETLISGLSCFLVRELGRFLLHGKRNPMRVFELICLEQHATEAERTMSSTFSDALGAFRNRAWDEALALWGNCLNISANDGPSRLYLKLCERYRETPPGEDWDGLIHFDK